MSARRPDDAPRLRGASEPDGTSGVHSASGQSASSGPDASSGRPDATPRLRGASGIVRPLVIGVMVGCIALSVARLARLLAEAVGAPSTWTPAYFFVACVLAALEAYYGRRWTESMEGAELWKFRAREILAFFILLKMGSYLGESWTDVQADIQTWLRYPARILSAEMILALLLSLLSWFASMQTLRDMERLDESLQADQNFADVTLPPPMQSLSTRFLWGGALLLIVAGINRVGVAALLNVERPPVPGIVLNVLVYFLLGLVMLGQVRFVALQVEWRGERATVAGELYGQWLRYSLVFIGLAAAVAFLLPTGYTTYLLDVLGVALALILQVLYLVGTLLLILLSLPFWLLAWLFMRDEAPAMPSPALPFRPPMQPDLGRAPPDWLGVARALFFWVVVLSIAYYLVRGYLREHPEIGQAILSFAPMRWLRGLWMALRRRVRALGVTIGERLSLRGRQSATPQSELTGDALTGWRSARGRVLYYYLNVLRRAAKVGFHRHASQTPNEFSAILERNLPEAREDMAFLTDAFTEARYSRHEVGPAVVQRARAGWQRIKHDLQVLAHPTRRPVVPRPTQRADGDPGGTGAAATKFDA
jgi:hypothetical protein